MKRNTIIAVSALAVGAVVFGSLLLGGRKKMYGFSMGDKQVQNNQQSSYTPPSYSNTPLNTSNNAGVYSPPKSTDVEYAQYYLNVMYRANLEIDGKNGPLTQAAIASSGLSLATLAQKGKELQQQRQQDNETGNDDYYSSSAGWFFGGVQGLGGLNIYEL